MTAIVPLAALRGDVFWSVSGPARPANVLFEAFAHFCILSAIFKAVFNNILIAFSHI